MHDMLELLEKLNIPHEVIARKGGAAPFAFETVRPASESIRGAAVFARPDASIDPAMEASVVVIARAVATVWAMSTRWSVVAVEDPRSAMQKVLTDIVAGDTQLGAGVDPTARVSPHARIHPSVTIGAFAIVGACEIGEGSRVGPFCRIYDGVVIGSRVTIREYCLIGGPGFGFVRDADSRLHEIPHIGGVRIDDDVDIFPYTNVDSGTLVPTRIGRGTKIDHYCHIGHNSRIGEDSLITAGTVLCGGARVGDRVWVGVGSILKQRVLVADESTTGLGSVVLKDVSPGMVVAGVPARPIPRKE